MAYEDAAKEECKRHPTFSSRLYQFSHSVSIKSTGLFIPVTPATSRFQSRSIQLVVYKVLTRLGSVHGTSVCAGKRKLLTF